jgi:hypothetical protein
MNFVDIIYNDFIKSNVTFYFSKNIPTIRKISNVHVKTELYFQNTGSNWDINFKITSSNINYGHNDKYALFENTLRKCSEVTKKDIKVSLQKMKKIIPNLKFDKMCGKIYTDKAKSFEQICLNEFGSSFIESNECCVCNETTTTKTNCCHFLCVECWSHIKSNQCPICREDNIHIENLDSSSDSDDELDDETEYSEN